MNLKCVACCVAMFLTCSTASASRDDLVSSYIVDEARAWQVKGRLDLASDAWNRLLVTHPAHGEALVSLGLIMAKSGDMKQAKALYSRAIKAKVPPYSLVKLAALVGEVRVETSVEAPVDAALTSKPATQKSKKTRAERNDGGGTAKLTVAPPSQRKQNLDSQPASVSLEVKVTPLPSPQIDTKIEPKLNLDTTAENSNVPKASLKKPRPVKPLPYYPDL